jgi:outer membrane protein OmpA-like peptidoglycan-associated protein
MGDITYQLGVRVDIVGHASARWRAARNSAEAARLNLELSRKRAETIRKIVEPEIRRELPHVTIVFAPPHNDGDFHGGLEMGVDAVGSTKPIAPGGGPNENQQANRSVMISLRIGDLTTVRLPMAQTIGSAPAYRQWTLEVMELEPLGVIGPLVIHSAIRINQPFTNQSMLFDQRSYGAGEASDAITSSLTGIVKARVLGRKRIGDEVPFQTKDPMTFGAFVGQTFRLARVENSIGAKIPYTSIGLGYGEELGIISFPSLGSDAQWLIFQKSHGRRTSTTENNWATIGSLVAASPNPDPGKGSVRYFEHASRHRGEHPQDKLVPFETESAEMTPGDREALRKFANNWAKNVALLATYFDL